MSTGDELTVSMPEDASIRTQDYPSVTVGTALWSSAFRIGPRSAMIDAMSMWDSYGVEDDGDGRAPICRWCGVTALPKHFANVIDTTFVCDNEDCEAFGDDVR